MDMAPDRGSQHQGRRGRRVLPPGQSFTLRGVAAGLAVGLVICFSNMFFGLQTGWVSSMTLPASLMGFGLFKLVSEHLDFPFSPVENVLVQTVAGSMALMPLGCGFVGVLPAMDFLLAPEELGPVHLPTWKLVVWSLGLCYFGVVFAVPLRRQVIIRERLRFPSGFSTAVLIGVLHGQTRPSGSGKEDLSSTGGFASLVPDSAGEYSPLLTPGTDDNEPPEDAAAEDTKVPPQWATNMRLLLICFCVSAVFTVLTYFFPMLRNLAVFGGWAAESWLWTLNPSLAYLGQGIIMGPETTTHMLLGAIVGWAILSPLAHNKGWAPGHVGDWETGSRGWIVWVSLAIMLADAVVSLLHVSVTSVLRLSFTEDAKWRFGWLASPMELPRWLGYKPVDSDEHIDQASPGAPSGIQSQIRGPGRPSEREESEDVNAIRSSMDDSDDDDAPAEQQLTGATIWVGLTLSILLCILTIHIVFGSIIPLYATILSVLMALILSVMGVRALGETDLNPVSGISKVAQLFFALVVPASSKASVLVNLIGGAVAEAGALQAGELMQDLKTGHLLGAAPAAQFWGQVIGASVGAVVSAFVYRLYTSVYEIPSDLFQVPTGYLWIFTARLVTGKGLPPMSKEWASGAALLFGVTTVARILAKGRPWKVLIPGGISVAVGMYNVPSFTLARAIGGFISWYWISMSKKPSTPLIVLASGFILGEGSLSILNLVMQSLGVPHF